MDNQWLWFLAIGITVALVAAYLLVGRYRKQRRTNQMRAAAKQLGYEFLDKEEGLVGALDGITLLSRGRLLGKNNFMRTRVDGTTVTLLDYDYMVGHGRRQHTYRQSVLLFESPSLDLPAFTLRPEGLGAKLQGLKGQQDIDFDEHPRFSSAYLLQGSGEAEIRALFSPEKLDFFAGRPGLCVEGSGQKLLYYRDKKRVSPDAISSFLQEGLAALKILAA